MNAPIVKSNGHRPLFIDFDSHTDGDTDFKKELISLMVENIRELQQALYRADQQNDYSIFSKTCHKVNATIGMLDDKDLTEMIEQMSDPVASRDEKKQRVASLSTLCDEIVKSLEKEAA